MAGPAGGTGRRFYCQFHLKGTCKKGDDCLFAHVPAAEAERLDKIKAEAKAAPKAEAKAKAKAKAKAEAKVDEPIHIPSFRFSPVNGTVVPVPQSE